jgi:hypothetical protein
VDFPDPCEYKDNKGKYQPCCDEAYRKSHGCGVTEGIPWTETAKGDGYQGQSTSIYPPGADEAPYNRTCPQYYRRSPFVLSIMQDLDDYKEGRIPNIYELEAPFLTYLKVANSEMNNWKIYQDEEMMPVVKK